MKAFLVQLRYPFRFESNGWKWVEREDGHFYRLFGSAKAARQFTHTTLPLWLNPFDRGAQIWRDDTLGCHPSMGVGERQHKTIVSIPLNELYERAASTGLVLLAPQESLEQRYWQAWWDLTTETMTWPQQAQLRRSLGVLPWVFNPFDYRFAWVEDDALCFDAWPHPCEMGWVRKGLSSLNLSPPSKFEHHLWHLWWSETQDAMSHELRDLVWWLLVPYPYQIVEVELEDGR